MSSEWVTCVVELSLKTKYGHLSALTGSHLPHLYYARSPLWNMALCGQVAAAAKNYHCAHYSSQSYGRFGQPVSAHCLSHIGTIWRSLGTRIVGRLPRSHPLRAGGEYQGFPWPRYAPPKSRAHTDTTCFTQRTIGHFFVYVCHGINNLAHWRTISAGQQDHFKVSMTCAVQIMDHDLIWSYLGTSSTCCLFFHLHHSMIGGSYCQGPMRPLTCASLPAANSGSLKTPLVPSMAATSLTTPVTQCGPFRNWKGFVSQNCLFLCSFALKFVYTITGWEGSTTDAHMWEEACHIGGLIILAGWYYLADAGFWSCVQLMIPYCNVWYHLAEWGRTG